MVLYLIVNTVNGKKYVGQTVRTVEKRWRQHIVDANCGKLAYLQNAIRKYGVESFFIVPLLYPESKELLNRYEVEFIRDLNTTNPSVGYNVATGGEGGSHPVALETREKISKSLTGRTLSEEHKENLRLAAINKKRGPMSEEQRRHISESLKGRVHSLESRKRMSESHIFLCKQVLIIRERVNNGRFTKSISTKC